MKWDIVPGLTVAEVFTDNLNLDEHNKQSDFVTSIAPGVRVQGTGSRAAFRLAYGMENLFYATHSENNGRNHNLSSSANYVVMPNKLRISGGASLDQDTVSTIGGDPDDNYYTVGGRTDVLRYHAAGNYHEKLGSLARLSANYRVGATEYGSSVTDHQGQSLNLNIGSSRSFRRTPWGIGYSHKLSHYDDGRRTRSQSLNGNVRWIFNRRWLASFSAGATDNSYGEDENFGRRTEGASWSTGLRWSPNRRNVLAVNYGDSYYGESAGLSLSHRGRRSSISASYSEFFSDGRFEQGIELPDFARNEAGEILNPFNGEPFLDENDQTITDAELLSPTQVFFASLRPEILAGDAIIDQVRLNKQLFFKASYLAGRTLVLASLRHSRSILTTDTEVIPQGDPDNAFTVQGGSTELTRAASLGAERSFGAKTRLTGSVQWSRISYDFSDNQQDIVKGKIGVTRALGRNARIGLTYSHKKVDDDFSSERYAVNKLAAILKMEFN